MQSIQNIGDYILLAVMFIFGAFFMLLCVIFHTIVLSVLLLIATIEYFENKAITYYHIVKNKIKDILNSVLGSRTK